MNLYFSESLSSWLMCEIGQLLIFGSFMRVNEFVYNQLTLKKIPA